MYLYISKIKRIARVFYIYIKLKKKVKKRFYKKNKLIN